MRQSNYTVLIGNFTARNFGDDLMLEGLITDGFLKDNTFVRVLCQSLSENKDDRFMPIRTLPVYRLFKKAEALILVGGSHFSQDNSTNFKTIVRLMKWWVLFFVAKLLNIRISYRAIGLEINKNSSTQIKIVRRLLRLATTITVRDKESLEKFYWIMGKRTTAVQLEEDLAYKFLSSQNMIEYFNKELASPESSHFFKVLLSPSFNHYDQEWWKLHISEILRQNSNIKYQFTILISGTQREHSDHTVALELQSLLLNEFGYEAKLHNYTGNLKETLREIFVANTIVSSRYHVVLVAKFFSRFVIGDTAIGKISKLLV